MVKVYYFHTDQIGTPLELTDSEGEIVWQATYRSWGAVDQLAVSEVEQNLRSQGQYFDCESYLHYNTFRYYDSEVERFTTQDPIGLSGGLIFMDLPLILILGLTRLGGHAGHRKV